MREKAVSRYLSDRGLFHDKLHKPSLLIGIYFLYQRGDLYYIGEAVNIARRIAEHLMTKKFDAVMYYPFGGTTDERKDLEGELIRALKPPGNNLYCCRRPKLNALPPIPLASNPNPAWPDAQLLLFDSSARGWWRYHRRDGRRPDARGPRSPCVD